MHIRTFFERFETAAPSAHKRALVGELTGPAAHARILETFLADDCFDLYFAGVFSGPLGRCAQANYPLTCLNSFGVHQLTMRRFPSEGSQIFLQVGCLDGHEFVLGLLRSADVAAHLVTAGARATAYDALVGEIREPWNAKPVRYDVDLPTYMSTVDRSVGFLAVVNLISVEAYLSTVSNLWPRLGPYADVVVQETEEFVLPLLAHVSRQAPELPIVAKRLSHVLSDGSNAAQIIAVFPRNPVQYSRMGPRLA